MSLAVIIKKATHSRTNIANLLFMQSAKFLTALDLMKKLPVTSVRPMYCQTLCTAILFPCKRCSLCLLLLLGMQQKGRKLYLN